MTFRIAEWYICRIQHLIISSAYIAADTLMIHKDSSTAPDAMIIDFIQSALAYEIMHKQSFFKICHRRIDERSAKSSIVRKFTDHAV